MACPYALASLPVFIQNKPMEKEATLNSSLATQGFLITHLELPDEVLKTVRKRDWAELDRLIALETKPKGRIFKHLRNYAEFSEIEFIISIRSSLQDPDEDGIWHDDGSRVLAFSLSLTVNPESIEGGRLEIRKQGSESVFLPTPAYGTMIVFSTGQQGYEHKINRVIQGERMIIAGWCT
jgi:hypothetical protein